MAMSEFKRTFSGKLNKYRFIEKVLIWVEGDDDISFYSNLISLENCQIESAGGKTECKRLADEMMKYDLKFVVVIDGDYDILFRRRSPHKRLVILNRYSIENYLFEKEIINNLCCQYCSINPQRDLVSGQFLDLIRHINSELLELLILDVANQRFNRGLDIFPPSYLPKSESRNPIRVSKSRIQIEISTYKEYFTKMELDEVRNVLQNYLKKHEVSHIINGHFIFSMIRDFVLNVISHECSKKITADNQCLYLLLETNTNLERVNSDHMNLKARVRRAIISCIT